MRLETLYEATGRPGLCEIKLLTDQSVLNQKQAAHMTDGDMQMKETAPAVAPCHRMPAALRMQQILDAALAEFGEHGFASTRIDDIATRCGLSKGGIYCHFHSKGEIFVALLGRHLRPLELARDEMPPATPVRPLVTWLVQRMHQRLNEPDTVSTLKLLIAEGARVPHLVERWRTEVLEPYWKALAALLGEAAARQNAKPSALVREPCLILAPAVLLMLMRMFDSAQATKDGARIRAAHVDMLCEWLAPDDGV
jgi:AcrR family transcriptional regulator